MELVPRITCWRDALRRLVDGLPILEHPLCGECATAGSFSLHCDIYRVAYAEVVRAVADRLVGFDFFTGLDLTDAESGRGSRRIDHPGGIYGHCCVVFLAARGGERGQSDGEHRLRRHASDCCHRFSSPDQASGMVNS